MVNKFVLYLFLGLISIFLYIYIYIAEEENFRQYCSSLFNIPVSKDRTEPHVPTPASCLVIEVLDEVKKSDYFIQKHFLYITWHIKTKKPTNVVCVTI